MEPENLRVSWKDMGPTPTRVAGRRNLQATLGTEPSAWPYSTVTDLARLRG